MVVAGDDEDGGAASVAMQGFRGPVERWGGRGSCGGASELVGGARGGRRWLLWRTAATVVFGRVRERARERGEEPGESEREQGGIGTACGSRPRGQELVGKQEVAARPCAREHAAASGRGEEDDGGLQWWAGPPAGWAGQLAGLHREEPR